jgi:mRNA interferase RelE/StbE
LAYRVEIQRSAEKELAALPSPVQARIIKAIDGLVKTPRPDGCKRLAGKNAYRVRIGEYRIVYEIYDKVLVVIVVRIAHTRDAYR